LEEGLNGHIGTAELANLLERSRRQSESLRTEVLHPHFAECAACRAQFEELALFDRQFRTAHITSAQAASVLLPEDPCPKQETWREVVVGLIPPADILLLLSHASRCNDCGPLLHRAVAELGGLNQSLSEAEKQFIRTLESASPDWQKRVARSIAGSSSASESKTATGGNRWFVLPRFALAGASLLAIVGAASWLVLNQNQPSADRLLARAYSEQRTLEPRMAGANYAPLRIARGPESSFSSRSASLLKAEALIATQLQSHPSDPAWLQAKAQADLLEGKYDAAVESLRRALELEPHSPAILTDLATAYFQRAEQDDKKEDLGAAYEHLSQALKLRPEDPVALFNRAIVAEHQFLYHQALDDWDHYLRIDPASQWADEARNHAYTVREILKRHGTNAPLLSPSEVVAASVGATAISEIDERIEEYLHEAVVSWLPQAFPEAHTSANADASQALFFLAELTRQRHGDQWLADLLKGSSTPHFPQAVNALSLAAKANDTGDYDVSRERAHSAEQVFRATGNFAGVLRARFEQIFASQIERRNEECRRQATFALADSGKYPYRWLEIQLGLEQAACSADNDIGADEKASARAMDRAQNDGYASVYLRAVHFAADDKLSTGNQRGAVALANAGLSQFWSKRIPYLRGYSLYVGLADAAEAANQPNLQVAIWREAVSLVSSDDDLLQKAMAHSWLAHAATDAGIPQIAQREYAEAARLFAIAPRSAATEADAIETEIHSARLEARLGRFDEAIARLVAVQDQVRMLSTNYLPQIFYSTLGELQLGRHREREAEQALRPALAFAEQSLASLRSEQERISWSSTAAPAYLALIEAELLQGRSQEALETYEWYLGAPQRVALRRTSNSSEPGPAPLAPRLPLFTKETVLSYGVLPDGLAIWVFDDRGVISRWIPGPVEGLQELAARFQDLSSDPTSEPSALRRDARNLYDRLVAPVEQQLAPGRTLLIEAEGWLARVPFEALLDSKSHYLIERAAVVHSLGQDAQSRLRRTNGISSDLRALVVGSTASSAADGLIPLPDVSAEADAVAARFRITRVLKGHEATLTSVRRELSGASVFHFAGHSLDARQGAGLLLESSAEGANTLHLVDASVVRQLRLQSLQLAVLSACSTGFSGGGSSGFDNFADALLRAGVPHVIASRWAVDSVVTRGFVHDFYANALSGQTVSEAIRRTSQKMLSDPTTAHPYYWAAFAAYGRP
jgi:CHAT domain-containing protein/cytochrome c-type biogenesis protein CcmH/NrfG